MAGTRQRNKDKLPVIIDAAKAVFARNGFYNSQISKIAKQAGVADGTIYLYFRNKEEILVRLFEHQVGSYILSLKEQLKQLDDARQRLSYIVDQHLQILEEDPDLARVFQLELRQPIAEIRKGIAPILHQYFQIIEDTVCLGQQQGYFDSELSAKLIRKIIFGSIDEVATSWVFSQKNYSLTSQAAQLIRVIFRGISK
ncbi:TetR family transcriptional regulator [Heliobacillus mobilis]|uniref:TetR family transcriptional regulator n=1 Tax=Heliobacterium mobile TaxID=28064 RepID=A0A6I3SP17_HELMO|nr:TetR/AcrR family transcriptional regulator [Heliobacterium mobile]MTV50758.1 TetR family transcriptional regulator [Heliobacterium mobile]